MALPLKRIANDLYENIAGHESSFSFVSHSRQTVFLLLYQFGFGIDGKNTIFIHVFVFGADVRQVVGYCGSMEKNSAQHFKAEAENGIFQLVLYPFGASSPVWFVAGRNTGIHYDHIVDESAQVSISFGRIDGDVYVEPSVNIDGGEEMEQIGFGVVLYP